MNDDRPDEGNSVCPACGRTFVCGMKAGAAKCWCAEKPHGLPVPAPGTAGCYCPECLAKLMAESAPR